jgi:hypothetical protein
MFFCSWKFVFEAGHTHAYLQGYFLHNLKQVLLCNGKWKKFLLHQSTLLQRNGVTQTNGIIFFLSLYHN